jgi:hypothetical protein
VSDGWPSLEFLSSVSSREAVDALETSGGLTPSLLTALRGGGHAVSGDVVAAASTPVGPFVVGELASVLDAALLFAALGGLTHAPLRMRRVLARMRKLTPHATDATLLAALLQLEVLLGAAPSHGPLARSRWLPRSLGVVLDSIVAVCECSGRIPVQASAATPVVVLADSLGVRSLFDIDGRDDPRASADRFDVTLARQVAHGMLLAGADGCAARLLHLLTSTDPDPAGVERRTLRRLLLSGRALVPPDVMPRLWRTTLGA